MSPNYAWYFLALVPFIPLAAAPVQAPIWALTLGAFLLYRPLLPAAQRSHLEDARHAAVPPRRRVRMAQPAPERLRCDSPSATAIVSVVIPCLNEEEPIAGVVAEVLAQGVDEVIVVDNGSTDATAARAAAAGARVVSEPRRGYGRACAAGLAAVRGDAEIVCLSRRRRQRRPGFPRRGGQPGRGGQADFVMGSRLRGKREAGSMTPQQLVAGHLAGVLMRLVYGVRFTDMSPFRAMRVAQLRALGMTEATYGWNLEMQMRAAAAALRIREIPVDHRCRRGGVSKVSGNLTAGLSAAGKITTTFLRLAMTLRRQGS